MKTLDNYSKLSDKDKADLLVYHYCNQQLSLKVIADAIGKYPNFVRREMKRLGIERRNRSQAQTVALKTGRHTHPTEGTTRPEDVKLKIGKSAKNRWENLSDEEKEEISERAKKQWEDMSEQEKEAFHRAAGDAIRRAAKYGSKLEKYLFNKLIHAGYKAEFHKEHVLRNESLQVDIWLPELNVAIEVDGPSHLKPIWGEKTLSRNKRADEAKTGLLLGRGLVILRVQQTRSLSTSYQHELFTKVAQKLEQIKKKFPPRGHRHIIIGE